LDAVNLEDQKMRTLKLLSLAATLMAGVATMPSVHGAEADTYRQLDLLMDVFERVRAEYVVKPDDKKLLEGAINGMLASLDPHSSFLDARDFDSLKTQTDGEYGGLGIEITADDGAIKVVGVFDDSPAAKAGMKAGDYITHVNKEPMFGLTSSDAVDKMRGPAKTGITLTLARKGTEKPFDVTVIREVIQPSKVRYSIKDNSVGYIRVPQFHRRAAEGVRTAITALDKQAGGKLTGYVLDLRGNPGGLLDQAVDMSDVFLERGEIVSQRGRRKEDVQRYFAKPGDMANGKPVIVLVNEFSASASEIVAGALQDHRRGIVLGRKSFGKGSVQTLIPLGQDIALRLTTARYFTPSGRSVQEQGIEPDVDVAQLSADQKPNDDRPTYSEADLRGHLTNDKKADARLEERDTKIDPRQTISMEALKKSGVDDFQLDYAVKLMKRLNTSKLAQR
jgi:carboxyl-terminal processing protease